MNNSINSKVYVKAFGKKRKKPIHYTRGEGWYASLSLNMSILVRKKEKIIIPLNRQKCLCKHILTIMIVHFEASHGNVQITLLSKSIVQLWIDLNIMQHSNPIDF